ncbi:MAG: radical SAM protein [Chloroflexi bacterium HGW-Chloroflexi-10]|nr:MAG: radical SAM protein [Chloroflexi bacterium HGW-Chloroflexi-10]
MIKEIQAKQLLSHSKGPDPWFGIQYTMNLYRGCPHQCIYCDSRSECYQIENFADVLVKTNALELLPKELAGKRTKGTIGTGSMNDPYSPVEKKYNLLGRALKIISQFGFPVHVLTKSDLVVRDMEILQEIDQKTQALVTFTITTHDDNLGKKVEPGAPLVSSRYAAMEKFARRGLRTGISLMPVLPFIEDNWDNIREIVYRARDAGASYIIASFGMTQRKGQQEYYYRKLDELFPGVRQQHHNRFRNDYICPANQANQLCEQYEKLCQQVGIAIKVPIYHALPPAKQLSFFDSIQHEANQGEG